MKRCLSAFFVAALAVFLIPACKKEQTGSTDNGSTTTDDGFVTNTRDTIFPNAVVVRYSGTTATVTNPFENAGISVAISNGDVVITSTVTSTEINYVLSGQTTNGLFKLYSTYKFNLVLNGVSLLNDNGPAINIQSGKKVSVNVLEGTSNRLADGTTYAAGTTGEDMKAAFFSEGQLNFAGTGSLGVTGNYKHAICSDGYIAVTAGHITVAKAVSDGLHANDYFKQEGGTVTVTASGDGIDAEKGYVAISGGTLKISSTDDGITASYDSVTTAINPYVSITGGVIDVTTTGVKGNAISSGSSTTINSSSAITLKTSGNAAKGFKSNGNFTITNGNISIATSGNAYYDAADAAIAAAAGINCDGNLSIAAGTISITGTGTGGKGISTDGTTSISGGTINIAVSGGGFTYGSQDSEAKGIKSDGAISLSGGSISIAATDDGIKSDASVTIGGSSLLNITRSTEGVEAPSITVNGGTISIVCSDDGFNATKGNGGESNDGSLLTFNGGTVSISTTGGDALDSNGSIVMTGGTVIAQGPPSAPEVAIDYNGTFNISGGLLVASGPNAGNMIQATSSTSAQYTVLARLSGGLAANTLLTIQNASGVNLMTYAPARTAYYLVFSASSLQSGSTYKIFTGGTITGTTAVNGLYTGGTYSGGTQRASFTVSSKLTSVSF